MPISHSHRYSRNDPLYLLSKRTAGLTVTTPALTTWSTHSDSITKSRKATPTFMTNVSKFVKMTAKKRVNTIASQFAGAYFLCPSNKVRHILLPAPGTAVLDATAAQEVDFHLGNADSRCSKSVPVLILHEHVGSSILHVLPANSPLLTDEVKASCHIGIAFTSTTPSAAPIKDLIDPAQASTSLVLISLPALLPIDWDSDLATGTIEDNLFQLFRSCYGTLGALWLTSVSDHSPALQLAAINAKATLGTIFPNHRAIGTTYAPTSTTAVKYPSPDDEDILSGDLLALESRLAAAAPAPQQPPSNGGIPDTIGGADDNASSKSITILPNILRTHHLTWISDATLSGGALIDPRTGISTLIQFSKI